MSYADSDNEIPNRSKGLISKQKYLKNKIVLIHKVWYFKVCNSMQEQ